MDFSQPLSFSPIYQKRVWGGRILAEELGRAIPDGSPVGESWDLVDREEAQSVVDFGPHKGMTLHTLWTVHREQVFGSHFADRPRFPLLFKILDCRELLSLQVHPPEKKAFIFGGEPKTEAWVMLQTQPAAEVFVGFKEGVTKQQFESALNAGELVPLLHRIPVKKGDAILVPSGSCHAIGAGCLIAEIQQNSDTTYRVFDWNRLGLDGAPRDLHLKESLECINFQDYEPDLAEQKGEQVVSCPYFNVTRWTLTSPRVGSAGQAAFYLVMDGAVDCGGRRFERGSTFLVPAVASELPLASAGEEASVLSVTHGLV